MSATATAVSIEQQIEQKLTDMNDRVRLNAETLAQFTAGMVKAHERQDDRTTICLGELETQIRDVMEEVALVNTRLREFRAWVNTVVVAQQEMTDLVNLAHDAMKQAKQQQGQDKRRKK